MNILIICFIFIAYNVYATTVTRSLVLYSTASRYNGFDVGSLVAANSACNTSRPTICMVGGAPQALLSRDTFNMSSMSLNGTVPVMDYISRYTLCTTYASCFVERPGGDYLRYPLQILGSVGFNQSFWTGSDVYGKYINEAASCGGNWTVNTTGNTGITGITNHKWITNRLLACEDELPFLCACESNVTSTLIPPTQFGWCGTTFSQDWECYLVVLLTTIPFTLTVLFLYFFDPCNVMRTKG
jgi:hypothetical protein